MATRPVIFVTWAELARLTRGPEAGELTPDRLRDVLNLDEEQHKTLVQYRQKTGKLGTLQPRPTITTRLSWMEDPWQ